MSDKSAGFRADGAAAEGQIWPVGDSEDTPAVLARRLLVKMPDGKCAMVSLGVEAAYNIEVNMLDASTPGELSLQIRLKKKQPRVIERLLEALRQYRIHHEEGPDFLVCPASLCGELQDAILTSRSAHGGVHPINHMAAGTFKFAGLPVFPGTKFGTGCFQVTE